MPDRRSVHATVRLQNCGSLSWRAGRGVDVMVGMQRGGSSGSTGDILRADERVAPGAVVDIRVDAGSVGPDDGAELFVEQKGMPWDDWTSRVTDPIQVQPSGTRPLQ